MSYRLRALVLLWSIGLLAASCPVLAVDIKIATLAPDGTLWMQEMRKGGEEIAKRTDGRVTFKFYPGGSMGSDRQVLRKIRAGQLQGGALTGGALADISADFQIYNVPFLFRSSDELDYVRARLDKTLEKSLEDHGFVTFGFTDGGVAYIMSNARIGKVDDLKSQKVWLPEGDDISRALFETLGISPVPLPLTDVLTGLQTGLITTIASSSVGAIALQWHTRIKYVTDLPTLYLFGSLAVDKKVLARLSPADQTTVREIMERIFAELNRQNRIDDRNARAALVKQGVQYLPLPPEEVAKLHAATDTTVERLSKNHVLDAGLLQRTQELLTTYRRSLAGASGR